MFIVLNDFRNSHYVKPPIDLFAYSTYALFDKQTESNNHFFQFRMEEYKELLEATPMSNNIELITFKSQLDGNHAQVNFSLTNLASIFRIKLKMQRMDGGIEYLEVSGYKNHRLKVIKL